MSEKVEEWHNRTLQYQKEKNDPSCVITTLDPTCIECYPIVEPTVEFKQFWILYQGKYVTDAVSYSGLTQRYFEEIKSMNGEVLAEGFTTAERRLERLIESMQYEDTLTYTLDELKEIVRILFQITNYFEHTNLPTEQYLTNIIKKLGVNITKNDKFRMFWEWWQIQTTTYMKSV